MAWAPAMYRWCGLFLKGLVTLWFGLLIILKGNLASALGISDNLVLGSLYLGVLMLGGMFLSIWALTSCDSLAWLWLSTPGFSGRGVSASVSLLDPIARFFAIWWPSVFFWCGLTLLSIFGRLVRLFVIRREAVVRCVGIRHCNIQNLV